MIYTLLVSLAANALAVIIAAYFVPGVAFTGDFFALLTAGAIFTLINSFVKPLLKLFFGPLILLTLGIFLFMINVIAVYLLDVLSKPITIQGFVPLVITTLIITGIQLLIGIITKQSRRR